MIFMFGQSPYPRTAPHIRQLHHAQITNTAYDGKDYIEDKVIKLGLSALCTIFMLFLLTSLKKKIKSRKHSLSNRRASIDY